MLYQSIDANTWPQDSNQSPRYLPRNSQAVLAEASHPHPAPSPPKNSRSPQYGKRCQLFILSAKLCFYLSNPCHRGAGHRAIWDCGRLNIHSRKIGSMSRWEDYQDSLLKYRGSSFTLFVNFARIHLLGWISTIQCRLFLTASYAGHIRPFIHLQTTTPTPTVPIQLPITSLYRTFHVPTQGYIRHRKTGISPLLPSYPFLPRKEPVKMTACLP